MHLEEEKTIGEGRGVGGGRGHLGRSFFERHPKKLET